MSPQPGEITELLVSWSSGDDQALEKLIPLVYLELRKFARRYMGRESPDHTLQTSALINEAYLKLVDQRSLDWQNRAHFFAVAAKVMRNILIDHARGRRSTKRGAGAMKVTLNEVVKLTDERATELVALDDALKTLAEFDARQSQIVELRFFGGLSIDETAEVMKISPATVTREWRAARAWLRKQMSAAERQI
jgi:RNA polymerase sigma factor (TIGR02999 family)